VLLATHQLLYCLLQLLLAICAATYCLLQLLLAICAIAYSSITWSEQLATYKRPGNEASCNSNQGLLGGESKT